MNISTSSLKLAAIRAFLGVINPQVSLIKLKALGSEILLTVVVDQDPSKELRAAVSIAATEIIADFPQATLIREIFLVSDGPAPKENVMDEGWIYQRAPKPLD